MNQNICYIVGAMSLTPALRPYPVQGDYVIAADRGFDSLIAYGVNPDLAVGDFDSLGHRPSHPNVIQLPAEKDDTDMVYAIRKGLELGYRRFILLGGVGGRWSTLWATSSCWTGWPRTGPRAFWPGRRRRPPASGTGNLSPSPRP